jgi:hypothetical protein
MESSIGRTEVNIEATTAEEHGKATASFLIQTTTASAGAFGTGESWMELESMWNRGEPSIE